MSGSQKNKHAGWFRPFFENEEVKAKKPCIERTSTDNDSNFDQDSMDDGFDAMILDLDLEKIEKKSAADNWLVKFAPVAVNELAVNSKKIKEIEDWLASWKSGNVLDKMLLITGPSGSGKTAAVNVIARNLGFTVSEWITPMDIEHEREFGDKTSYMYQEKQSDRFTDFLIKASRFPSLLNNSAKRALVVEDYPNVFLKNTGSFHDVLQKYKTQGNSPLIFICSESNAGSLNIIWNLFPASVLEKFNIKHISLNAVTTTKMKTVLNGILSIMDKGNDPLYQRPDLSCVDSIINSSMGDLISAVNNLQYSSLKGSKSMQIKRSNTKPQKGKTSRKKTGSSTKLETMGKDENLSLMHGVGRVLNPKFVENTKKLTHNPAEISEQFQTQPTTFIGCIQENYLPHFSNIEHVSNAADCLSVADYFMSDWKEIDGKSFGMYVAISGTMLANESPVSLWHPIKASKHLPNKRSFDVPLIDPKQLIRSNILMTDYKTYCAIISTQAIKPQNEDLSEEEFIIED